MLAEKSRPYIQIKQRYIHIHTIHSDTYYTYIYIHIIQYIQIHTIHTHTYTVKSVSTRVFDAGQRPHPTPWAAWGGTTYPDLFRRSFWQDLRASFAHRMRTLRDRDVLWPPPTRVLEQVRQNRSGAGSQNTCKMIWANAHGCTLSSLVSPASPVCFLGTWQCIDWKSRPYIQIKQRCRQNTYTYIQCILMYAIHTDSYTYIHIHTIHTHS